jgi:hypothetical protein
MKYNKIEQHIKNLFEQREGLIEQIEEIEKELEKLKVEHPQQFYIVTLARLPVLERLSAKEKGNKKFK